jgi:hypothetical protein
LFITSDHVEAFQEALAYLVGNEEAYRAFQEAYQEAFLVAYPAFLEASYLASLEDEVAYLAYLEAFRAFLVAYLASYLAFLVGKLLVLEPPLKKLVSVFRKFAIEIVEGRWRKMESSNSSWNAIE